MKIKYLVILIIVFMVLGCISTEEKQPPISTPTPVEIPKEEKTRQTLELPQSLDQYYRGQPVFLFKMVELGRAMMGVVTDFQQNDTNNTKTAFETFSKLYEESSNLVPEWSKYYNIDAVNRLGEALDSGDPGKVFPALDEIGKTCGNCHKVEKPSVWAKYYWKDFRTVTMNTSNPQEPELPFTVAKMKYLVPAFDGTIVNLKEKQQREAANSWNQFNTAFSNMEKTCLNCHNTPIYYFTSQDIKSLISKAGQQITAGDLEDADKTMQQIGTESCYKCHIVHEPPQRLKELMK